MTQTVSEDRLWEGTPSQWINFKLYLICALTCWLIIPIGIAFWRWLTTRNTHYELTRERIFLTTGVLSKQTDTLELYRVRDIRITQSFWIRMVGLYNVILETTDRTTPTFVFQAIQNGRELSDQIRDHVEVCRKTKGVREVDFE